MSACTCIPVENPWTYYGATEPGGALEPDPDCPVHFPAKGVWAVVDIDYGESITEVYPVEVEALRAINRRGYGRVRFVPFGISLVDLDIAEKMKP